MNAKTTRGTGVVVENLDSNYESLLQAGETPFMASFSNPWRQFPSQEGSRRQWQSHTLNAPAQHLESLVGNLLDFPRLSSPAYPGDMEELTRRAGV